MSLAEVAELQLGPRKRVRPGQLVRLSGGGGLGHRGLLMVRRILRDQRHGAERFFLDGLIDGVYVTAFVAGKPYCRHGQKWIAHKVTTTR